jgi:phosphodiesterase/alkaline phosphatase D-like protein
VWVLTAVLVASSVSACRFVSPQQAPAPVTADADALMLWSGAVTPTSARVTAAWPHRSPLDSATSPPDLLVDTSASMTTARRVGPQAASAGDSSRAPSDGAFHFDIDGLAPATTYHYRLLQGEEEIPDSEGRFRTFARGAHSFRVVMSGCAETGSRHPVFRAIADEAPDLFLHLGDLHYEDIATPDIDQYRQAFASVTASPEQASVYRSVPLAYMWDDHDYGPNNSSSAASVQETARQAYRRYVPHYPLASGSGGPVHQRFDVGRVRFLLTDLRSARTQNDAPDTKEKTMLGAEQKSWFRKQLVVAADENVPLVVWVSSVPWIANDPDEVDRWGGFSTEREQIAGWIDSLGLSEHMMIVSGDAHMVAFDDGTNNTYGPGDGIQVPVVQAAALDRTGSTKGGPYTIGPFPNRFSLRGANDGQYVRMDVDDRGDAVCVTWTGRRWAYDDATMKDLFRTEKCFLER